MEFAWSLLILIVIVLVVAIAIAWWLLSRLYERASTEVAFVRTGFLGRRVVISGGAFVVPVLHQTVKVGMNTLRLTTRCENEASLITRDRIRVDVVADFYVHVEPGVDAVAAAAQTLGRRTMSADALLALVEAKFVDALRAVAAERSLEELHESRQAFASRVAEMVAPGLGKNGLTIETVSIAKLDQTGREFFNPNNAFDAAGLTWLTQEIEERRRKRNEIERDAQVAIQRKNLAAEQQMLDLAREEEVSRLTQEREIAIQRASQGAEISIDSATRKRESDEAVINVEEAVRMAKLRSDATIRQEQLRLEKQVREAELARAREVEIAEVDKRKQVELAEQQREIEIAQHAGSVAAAQGEAERARADAVRAEESVISARDIERAERAGRVELAAARTAAEKAAVARIRAAEAERAAAEQQAEATRIATEAEVAAARLRAAADETRYAIDAAGRTALYEAENVQSDKAADLRTKLAVIERLESIIRESARPLERIEGIKIVQLSGTAGADADGTSLSDQVVSSALRYRTQAPLVDALLSDLGLPAGGKDGLIQFAQSRDARSSAAE